MTLEEQIRHFAELTPGKTAVACCGRTLSYAELWQEIQQEAARLQLHEGEPHAFLTTQDTGFVATYCGIHLCGGVAVPLEASMPAERQAQIWKEIQAAVGLQPSSDILFTTGTTGTSKGVMVSQKAWTANAENLIDRLGFTSDLLFITAGPLNHLGCLSKIYPTLMSGATLFIMENLKDLPAFFEVFRLPYARFATFLVPSSIRMLLQVARKELRAVAAKVDFIETGAAPISQHDMELLCQTLPHSRLYNTYASTETGIICSYEYSRYGCIPGLLGKPMKHSSVRTAAGGQVICSGETIMSGYVNAPKLSAKVLRGGEVYTSDIGSIDEEDGMLRLQGRQDDVINVGGFKVNPSEVEDAAVSLDAIADCICVPATHLVVGTVAKLLYVPKAGATVKPRDIAIHLRGRLEEYKVPLLYEEVGEIRRTYNGKPDRKAYTMENQ